MNKSKQPEQPVSVGISAELAKAMYQALDSYGGCMCRREFKYHGKSVYQCGRCAAMEAYELAVLGESKTKNARETYKP